jgi:hypothetical protein
MLRSPNLSLLCWFPKSKFFTSPMCAAYTSHLLTYSVALVRKRTTPTEWPPLSAKLVPTSDRECHVVSVTDPYGRILGFLDRGTIPTVYSSISTPPLLEPEWFWWWCIITFRITGFLDFLRHPEFQILENSGRSSIYNFRRRTEAQKASDSDFSNSVSALDFPQCRGSELSVHPCEQCVCARRIRKSTCTAVVTVPPHTLLTYTHNFNSMVWVRVWTIPTERPPLVGEVIANFCG